MGEVYEAEDLLLGRRVAVKLLREDLAHDARLAARFRREARTAASLTHPRIVAVHDVGLQGDRAFFVMELVEGRSLGEVRAAGEVLEPARAARIGGQIADALAYAHAHGVVHRDVAPGNVMLTAEDAVKLLDLGIASVDRGRAADVTAPLPSGPATTRGTLAYLAPEQVRGGPGDQRADLYALGAVLFELLTGRPPGEPEAHPRALRPEVPVELDAIVARCLAADPASRYARADEVRDALTIIGERVSASDVEPAGRRAPVTPSLSAASTLVLPAPARARHHRGRWLAAAVVMAVLLGVFVGMPVWRAMSAPPARHPSPVATQPLSAPAGVSSTGTCDGFWSARVALQWPASAAATGYEVYRADVRGGPYDLVQRLTGGASTSWIDRDRGVDRTYYYVLRAVDGARRSPLTPELAAQTPALCLG
jgi:serine/threonine-protein kinase